MEGSRLGRPPPPSTEIDTLRFLGSENGPVQIGVVELQDDVSPAQWVVDLIHPLGQDVGSVVPDGYEAYARIFHPAHYHTPGEERTVRWAEIATAKDREVHPEMQFPHLTGQWPHRDGSTGEPVWNHEPDEGCLPRDQAAVLATLLARFTTTPHHCWFCVWEGFGGSKLPYDRPHKVELPGRTYHLLSGPIEGINETFGEPWFETHERWQSANLWWPDDRAWFAGTEIDFMSTYVGGSQACIDALLAAPEVEVMEAQITDGISYASDRINPPPEEPWR